MSFSPYGRKSINKCKTTTIPPLCHQPQHNTSSHITTTNINIIHTVVRQRRQQHQQASTATQYIIMPISHTHTDSIKPQPRRKIHLETTLNNNHQHNCIFLFFFYYPLHQFPWDCSVDVFIHWRWKSIISRRKKEMCVYKFSPISPIRKMSFNTIRYGCGGIMGML